MTNQPNIPIERMDHDALPGTDLNRAFRFWTGFLGARLKLSQESRGVVECFLYRRESCRIWHRVVGLPIVGTAITTARRRSRGR
jgi:hypothetical protein